jgi:hypothetical protein
MVCVVLLAGCRTASPVSPPRDTIAAGDLIARHNARVAQLGRVWARTSVQVTARDERGSRLREQAEGHLQIEGADRFALSLGKLGKTQLYLGSNEQVYWWIDMVDPDQKIAIFGRHANVNRDKAALLGVPVYPTDLVHLLGMTPIDSADVRGDVKQADGLVGLEAVLRDGVRTIWFDLRSMEPARIELHDDVGRVVLSAELSRYDYVTVVGDATSKPRLPGTARVVLVADETRIDISLYAAENRPIRPSAFDFEGLARGYRVDEIFDLDTPVAGEASP